MMSYKINYFASAFSLFAALISACTHQLGFMLINFFFAVFNYYIAEWKKRGIENESNRETTDEKEDDE